MDIIDRGTQMQLVILAAGAGSRLQPYSDIIPKSMMPVDGIPIIRRIFDKWVFGAGVHDVVVCINKEYEKFFKHEFRDICGMTRFVTSSKPLGTAGEVWNARKLIKDDFILYYGDMLTNINPTDIVKKHREYKNQPKYIGTLAAVRGTETEKGLIDSDKDGNIIRFVEKPPLQNWAWAAIGIFTKDILKYCHKGKDFGTDVFTKLLSDGYLLKTCRFDALWCDIGNIRNYELANQFAVEGKL